MITRSTFESLIGEGFHTAFRKAVDTAAAATIHRLIGEMPPEEWAEVVSFVADGMPPEMFQPDPEPMPTGDAFLAEFTRPDLMSPPGRQR